MYLLLLALFLPLVQPRPDDCDGTLIPHEADCSYFYVCDLGMKYLMQCPNGQHFNPLTNTCDKIASGGCTYRVTSTTTTTPSPTTEVTSTPAATMTTTETTSIPAACPSGTYPIPSPISCVSYLCIYNASSPGYLASCPNGFEYEWSTQSCDKIAPGGCTYRLTSTTTTTPSPTTEVTSTPPATMTNTETTSIPTACPSETYPIPSPISCVSYLCIYNASSPGYLASCPNGFEYEWSTQTCDKIAPGGCTYRLTSTTTTTPSPTAEVTSTPPATKTTTETTSIPAACPSGTYPIPSPISCVSYLCIYNASSPGYLVSCPNGFEYEWSTQTCDKIAPGGCTYRLTSTTTTTPSPTTEVTSTPAATMTTTETTSIPAACPSGTYPIPSPISCVSYLCIYNASSPGYLASCPNDFEYEWSTQTCDKIAPGGCTYRLTSTTTTTPSPTTEVTSTPAATMTTTETTSIPAACPSGTYPIPSPISCVSYLCIYNASSPGYLASCPNGFEYEWSTQTCDKIAPGGCTYRLTSTTTTTPSPTTEVTSTPPATMTTTETTSIPTACPSGTYPIPSPISCVSYLCIYNASSPGYLASCPNGFEYEWSTQTCDKIAPGGCTYRLTSTTTTTPSPTAEVTSTPPATKTTTETTSIPAACPSGTYPIPSPISCVSYLCIYNASSPGYLVSCPNGFEYEWSTQTCDKIAPGGCTYRLTSTTTTTPSPTTEVTSTPPAIMTTTETTSIPAVCPSGTYPIPSPISCVSYLCIYNASSPGYLASCPNGFEYEWSTQTCDKIAPGGCTYRLTSTTTTTPSPTTEVTSTPPATKTTTETTSIPAACPSGTYPIPSPISCVSYLCIYNASSPGYLVSCPNGFEYEWSTQTCDKIAPGGCTYRLTSTTTTTPSPTTEVTSTPAATMTTTETTSIPAACPSGTYPIPSPISCVSYLCIYNASSPGYLASCPNGFEYEWSTQTCDKIAPGGCTYRLTSTTTTTPSPTTEVTSTPAATMTTTETTSILAACPSGTYPIPSPISCVSYLCIYNASSPGYLASCPNGFEYEWSTQTCDKVAPGGCSYRQTTTSTTSALYSDNILNDE